MYELKLILDRVYNSYLPDLEDLLCLLSLEDKAQINTLFAFADEVRRKTAGERIVFRGVVEFANYCSNNCFYCGLNKENKKLTRYALREEEIIESVSYIFDSGINTVILQAGEDEDLDVGWLEKIIKDIKSRFPIAVTLSVGEKSIEAYRTWKNAGADRYLLKIETSHAGLYQSVHKQRSLDNRLRCLKVLKDLGYQTGSGNIIGLRGQTLQSIAEDIIFFKKEGFDMIAIGPFIPHPDTAFAYDAAGDIILTLKTLALTRIVMKNIHIPATTALASLGEGFLLEGIKSGADVLMLNFTPQYYRDFYQIYPGKKYVNHLLNSGRLSFEMITKNRGGVPDYFMSN